MKMYIFLFLLLAQLLGPQISEAQKHVSCTTNDGVVGQCISFYLCTLPNDTVGGVVNITEEFNYRPGQATNTSCPSYLDTCCPTNETFDTVLTTKAPEEVSATLPSPRIHYTTSPPPQGGKCTLPAYPINGRYIVKNAPEDKPGMSSDYYILIVSCDPGHIIIGGPHVFCTDGVWAPSAMPECKGYCKLNRHPSLQYTCRYPVGDSEGSRPCEDREPIGTVAWPECVRPNYVSFGELPSMRCREDGRWDENPICTPDCGQVNADGSELIIGGERAKRGGLPWHVGVYRKSVTPYLQICGGSIVRASVVISAAHCFWSEEGKLLPANDYAVAAGKLYRPWDDPHDQAQKADVRSIHIPQRFRGAAANFQHDLAILWLSETFVFHDLIRPVCLDLGENFDHLQLVEGSVGKVAGWGLTDVNGPASPYLKVLDLPIVPYDACFNGSPITFRPFITGDKICAGYRDKKTAVCKGDSGGGLAIAQYERGAYRYYLRGVVSTAPSDENLCNANSITTYTHLLKHAAFIKNHL